MLKKKLIIYFTVICFFVFVSSDIIGGRLKLNPLYKVKRMSTGVVVAYSTQTSAKHEFKDIQADIILAAMRKQTVKEIIPRLSDKYFFSDEECRREVKHAINVLTEWEILLPLEE